MNYRWEFSNDRNRGRGRDRSRTRVRCLTPRREDRRYQSPNSNSGTRNRSTYGCPNSVTDDSDGYESDRAALQLITTDVETHQTSEGTIPIEEQDHLNL